MTINDLPAIMGTVLIVAGLALVGMRASESIWLLSRIST